MSNVKAVCFVLVACFTISFQSKLLGKSLNITECTNQTNIPLKELSKQWAEDTLPDTKIMKCYVKCIFVEDKFMTEDGKLLPANVAEAFGEKPAQDCEKTATSQGGEDSCSVAYYYKKCIFSIGSKD